MLLPLSWLKEYTDVTVSPVEFANGITDSGSHVDSVTALGKPVSDIIVGHILSIEPHPNADRLKVLQIEVGKDRPLLIVTAATNVEVGYNVPVAVSGAVLADGTVIGNTDFRGVESEGMLCSLEELGVNDSVIPKAFADGIFLTKEGTPGEPFDQVIGSQDAVIDIEVTPNRPDCLSIIGMARESAATFQTELRLPSGRETQATGDIADYLADIQLESEDCLRYMGRVIHDVTIEPSPQWMQNRLMQAGMRPINNIVDITNYVMLEMGYPLHAFDIDTVKEKTIIVRHAKPGETLLLLNGTEKELISDDLVIADANEPIGLAGVMGGFDSEITSKTKNILIECAVFDRENIRLTAKRHNMRSEASSRYEKGITPAGIPAVMDRVCQLAEQIGVGQVVSGAIDRSNYEEKTVTVTADCHRINALLGTELSADEMRAYLERLGFGVIIESEKLIVTVPNYRTDIEMEADIAEEVARLHGFANITAAPIVGTLTEGGKLPIRQAEDIARQLLFGLGFSEALTYSFISEKVYDSLAIPKEDPLRDFVRLLNPLGEDFSVMRTTLLGNMLQVLENNSKNGQERLMMFELGNTFHPSEELLPNEYRTLCLGMYGAGIDFYSMKSVVKAVFEKMGVKGISFTECENKPYLHAGRAATMQIGGEDFGSFGELSFDVAEEFDTAARIYIGEFDFDRLFPFFTNETIYTPITRFPSMKRDLALVVDKTVRAADVQNILLSVKEPIVRSIILFDVYEGTQVPEGKKSMAFQVTYQDKNQTLREEDAQRVHSRLVETAQKELGATLRA